MTTNQFAAECLARCIMPELALEQPEIRQALKQGDDSQITALLDQLF